MTNQRYAHVHDDEYRRYVQDAIRQLRAALSETATDHDAYEKLAIAEQRIGDARRSLLELTDFSEDP